MSKIQPNQEINVTKNRKDDNPIFSAMLIKYENYSCFTPHPANLPILYHVNTSIFVKRSCFL